MGQDLPEEVLLEQEEVMAKAAVEVVVVDYECSLSVRKILFYQMIQRPHDMRLQ